MLALPIFVAGLILLLFNSQTLRQLAFPIAFLFFLVPPPSEILYASGATLSTLSSEVSTALVSLVGIPSTLNSQYGTPSILITRPDGTTMQFAVDIACSGIYSLVGFLIFAILIAYVIRDKPWKKFALILIGIPVLYLFNIIRITTTVLIGYQYGENSALQTFHLLGGWAFTLIGTLLLLVISEKILKTQIFAKKLEECPQCSSKPQSNHNFCFTCGRIKAVGGKIRKNELIKVFAIVASVLLLLSIQAPVFALTQSPAEVIINTPMGEQASTELFPSISGYNFQFAYRDTDFEEMAKNDMALAYIYTPKNESLKPIWIALEIASTRSTLHRWEGCLVNYPLQQGIKPKVEEIELSDIQLSENPPIISRYFAFRYTQTNATQAVLYWFESATFAINSTSQQKQVKISLIAYPDSVEELPKIKEQLLTIARPIVSYWQPVKMWSSVAVIMSQNGDRLVATTSTLLAAILIVYGLDAKRQRKINKSAYQKLSKGDKQMFDVIRETEKRATSTVHNIANLYCEVTGQIIDEDQLLQKLAELEKIGIIKSYIASKHDEPILIWKTAT
jgi:exosortase